MTWNRKWWTQAWRLPLEIDGLSKGHMSLKAAQATYEFMSFRLAWAAGRTPRPEEEREKDGRSYTRKTIFKMQTMELGTRGP